MNANIEQYPERKEKRQAFLQAGKDDWEHYRATGRHVTGSDADAWLAHLEAGNDIDLPVINHEPS